MEADAGRFSSLSETPVSPQVWLRKCSHQPVSLGETFQRQLQLTSAIYCFSDLKVYVTASTLGDDGMAAQLHLLLSSITANLLVHKGSVSSAVWLDLRGPPFIFQRLPTLQTTQEVVCLTSQLLQITLFSCKSIQWSVRSMFVFIQPSLFWSCNFQRKIRMDRWIQ